MALPLWMLKTLQIRTFQKIGLALLVLVATVDVVLDILRMIYDLNGGLELIDAVL